MSGPYKDATFDEMADAVRDAWDELKRRNPIGVNAYEGYFRDAELAMREVAAAERENPTCEEGPRRYAVEMPWSETSDSYPDNVQLCARRDVEALRDKMQDVIDGLEGRAKTREVDSVAWDVRYLHAGEWRSHNPRMTEASARALYESQLEYRPSTERFRLVRVTTTAEVAEEGRGGYER